MTRPAPHLLASAPKTCPEDRKPSIEFRIPDAGRQLSAAGMTERFRFWMRTTQPLPDDPRVRAAVFAYLSDWWLNFSALGLHLRQLGERRLYIASLNHAIWLHQPVQSDQWLHVDSTSPASGAGRGLAVGAVHNLAGQRMATLTQECLLAYAD
jgi:acyl-CoA thioesterase II